jgi:hypothetical protein
MVEISTSNKVERRIDQPDDVCSVVRSYNEWDPLEGAIVGVADGAVVPAWHVTLRATMPEHQGPFFRARVGCRLTHVSLALPTLNLMG